MRLLWVVGVAGVLNAGPVLRSDCELATYFDGTFVSASTDTGTSSCTLGDPRGPAPYAHAETFLDFGPNSITVQTTAMAAGHQQILGGPEIYAVNTLASASSFLEYTYVLSTPGPVRPGVVFIDASTFVGSNEPGVPHTAYVQIMMGSFDLSNPIDGAGLDCEPFGGYWGCQTADSSGGPDTFTLGVPFTITIRAGAGLSEIEPAELDAGAYATVNFRFAEAENPCSAEGYWCNETVNAFIVPVPEPNTAGMFTGAAALVFCTRLMRRRLHLRSRFTSRQTHC